MINCDGSTEFKSNEQLMSCWTTSRLVSVHEVAPEKRQHLGLRRLAFCSYSRSGGGVGVWSPISFILNVYTRDWTNRAVHRSLTWNKLNSNCYPSTHTPSHWPRSNLRRNFRDLACFGSVQPAWGSQKEFGSALTSIAPWLHPDCTSVTGTVHLHFVDRSVLGAV